MPARISIHPLVLRVKALNTTSGIPLDSSVQCVGLREKSIILEIPLLSCALKHRLALEMDLMGTSDPFHLEGTGEVSSFEKVSDNRARIEMSFNKIDFTEWYLLRSRFDGMQDNVDALMQKIRGY